MKGRIVFDGNIDAGKTRPDAAYRARVYRERFMGGHVPHARYKNYTLPELLAELEPYQYLGDETDLGRVTKIFIQGRA